MATTIHPDCRENFLPLSGSSKTLHNAGCQLVSVSYLKTGYDIRRGPRNYHIVFHTFGGQGRITYGGRDYVCTPGSVLLIPAPLTYGMSLDGEAWDVTMFHVTANSRWRLMEKLGFVLRPSDLGLKFKALMEMYLDEVQRPEVLDAEPANMLGSLLIALLERELGRNVETDRVRERLDAVWRVVADTPNDAWSTEVLCREASYSPRHFVRLCKDVYGKTPGQLLTDVRMARACELLKDPENTLDYIAYCVGYQTGFILSNAFKRHLGMRPKEYRSQLDWG